MIRFADFELSTESRQLARNGAPVVMRERALAVLLALVERAGEVVSKRELCRRAWPERDVDENNLQVEILGLRKLLGKAAIVTAAGRGYQFTLPVQSAPPGADPASRLIGRDDDAEAIAALLVPGSLVTITGEGGIGKTALARAIASRIESGSPDGAWFIEVGAAAALPAAIASALRRPPRLLVVDGCDTAIDAAAVALAKARNDLPAVALLATSREQLRAAGETLHRLEPLALEPADAVDAVDAGDASAAAPRHSFAAQLFRRIGAQRTPSSGAANPPADAKVDALCRLLDGNPLAIRLAAERVAAIGIDAVLRQLAAGVDVLETADPEVPARQRSIRASFDWSLSMLSHSDRSFYRALATLPQPFALDDVAAPASTMPLASRDRWKITDALARLVEKSLISVERDDPPRYRMSNLAILYAMGRPVADGYR